MNVYTPALTLPQDVNMKSTCKQNNDDNPESVMQIGDTHVRNNKC